MARKEEILDALIDIFRNQGVGADFTISQLADKANMGKSTIYEYFKTKDDIMNDAICRVFDESTKAIFQREIPSDSTFEQAYKGEMHYLFNIAINSQFLFNFLTPKFMKSFPVETREDFKSRMKDVASHYEKRFADIFIKGVTEGVISNDNMPIKGLLISSLVSGSIMRFANANMYTLIYFSPTGNTLYLANQLADQLNIEKDRISALEFTSIDELKKNKSLILMYSIHGFNTPRTVNRFVESLPEGLFEDKTRFTYRKES